MLKLHNVGIGKKHKAKSVAMLMAEEAKKNVTIGKHFPFISYFHAASTGMQVNMMAKILHIIIANTTNPTKAMVRRRVPSAKIRKYVAMIENLTNAIAKA